VRQTKFASSLDNFRAHYKIVGFYFFIVGIIYTVCVRWEDRIPYTETLKHSVMSGSETDSYSAASDDRILKTNRGKSRNFLRGGPGT